MNKSESIKELSTALAQAQMEVENASKNAVNPHFRNSYADLAEVLNTVRPVFTKHQLAITQWPMYAEGVASVETVLTHASGEFISNVASCRVTKDDAQGVGSAITYLRRYSLAAVAGIAQEDDDGNVASQKSQKRASNEDLTPLVTTLREAAMGGSESLQNAFKALPNTEGKKAVWAQHGNSLKAAAKEADKEAA